METVGIYLKKEREANSISLREVARITKITAIYLEHIEKDEFDKIPQGPYIKGYLSSYSRAIGCDVDKIINLYEYANRKHAQAEAIQPATATNDGRKLSANKSNTKRRKQLSSLHLGDLRSWLNTLVSFVVPKKPIDTADSAKPDNRKPLRHRVGRAKQSGLSVALHRWATDRRSWMYAFIALCGAIILFLAGVGFYHFFLYDADSVTIAEAETAQDIEKSLFSSAGSQPSVVPSQSTDAIRAAVAPKDHLTKNRPSEPAKSDAAVSGVRSETDISSGRSGPVSQIGAPSFDSSSTTPQAALLSNNADAQRTGSPDRQPIKSDPSAKPTIGNASLRVLKATICRTIENLMPAGVDQPFSTSDGKIYVWTKIAARQVPSKIHHIYYFGEKKISDVVLDVRSTQWRTWSSTTIANPRNRGEWRVDIATSNGDILQRLYFEVK